MQLHTVSRAARPGWGNLGKTSYFPRPCPVCAPKSWEKAGTAEILFLEAAVSPQALPRLQAGLGRAKVSGRLPPVPRDGQRSERRSQTVRGASLGPRSGAKGQNRTHNTHPTGLSAAETASLAKHARTAHARTRRHRGSDATQTIPGRRPAHLAGAAPVGARISPRRPQTPRHCQADAHLGARKSVCVAVEKRGDVKLRELRARLGDDHEDACRSSTPRDPASKMATGGARPGGCHVDRASPRPSRRPAPREPALSSPRPALWEPGSSWPGPAPLRARGLTSNPSEHLRPEVLLPPETGSSPLQKHSFCSSLMLSTPQPHTRQRHLRYQV